MNEALQIEVLQIARNSTRRKISIELQKLKEEYKSLCSHQSPDYYIGLVNYRKTTLTNVELLIEKHDSISKELREKTESAIHSNYNLNNTTWNQE